jgi:hypothetical protein
MSTVPGKLQLTEASLQAAASNRIIGMIRTLMLVLFVISPLLSSAKGGSGIYYISGKAYGPGRSLLANETITVDFQGKTWTVNTDNEGNYELEIRWYSACPSGATKAGMERQERQLNPKWIVVKYGSYEMKIQNQWKKYAKSGNKDKNEVTRKLDLQFT